MHSWRSAPLGNVRVLLVCFAGIALSSLETWPVSELKVASGKPKRKHCSKRISQEQEEKENSKKSRPFKQMPPTRAPVFLLSPGITTRGTTLPPCWIYCVTWPGIDQSDIFRQWKLFLTSLGQRTHIRHRLQRLTGCILPTMHCRSQHCWELLHLFAHHCQHVRNNSQHYWRNHVGSCCIRLHTA